MNLPRFILGSSQFQWRFDPRPSSSGLSLLIPPKRPGLNQFKPVNTDEQELTEV
jgi:hypothetical protein